MNSLKKVAYGAIVLAAIVMASCSSKPNYSVSLKSDTDSASYFLGYFYGKQMTGMGFEEPNIDAIAKGWQDAKGKVELKESEQEIGMFLQKYFTGIQEKANEKYMKEGQAFLEANKTKSGVVTLPNGLQYRIIKEGNGAKPTMEDEVDVVYHGTLTDGTVFDSSKDRQDTATFGVGRVVPGFGEALTLMNEGSTWEVFIPAELGYGENPNPRSGIKPNSVLVFEIDLVKVKKAAK